MHTVVPARIRLVRAFAQPVIDTDGYGTIVIGYGCLERRIVARGAEEATSLDLWGRVSA